MSGIARSDDVEALPDWKYGGLRRTFDFIYLRMRGTGPKQLLQIRQRCFRSTNYHFHPTIRKIPGVAAQSE
jgi:hypothetical protein